MQVFDLETTQLICNFTQSVPNHADRLVAITTQTEDIFGQKDFLEYCRSTTPIRAMVHPNNSSYIICAGTDRRINFWDLANPGQSYTISEPLKTKYSYKKLPLGPLSIFEETSLEKEQPSFDQSLIPTSHHRDAIIDLKCIEVPHQMLISAGRDGVIKVWS
jgi:WD40 repeat protein